jgi:hypothetical protein
MRDDMERARQVDSEFATEQARFFHRSRTLAQLSGVPNVSGQVKADWLDHFGTELSTSRFHYLAYHPGHERIRAACVQEAMSDEPYVLMREDPLITVDAIATFCKAQLVDLHRESNREIHGGSVMRIRDPRTGDWQDVPVVEQRYPAGAMAVYGGILEKIVEGKLKAATVAKQYGLAPAAQTSTLATQTNVFIGKATPLMLERDGGEPAASHFTAAQVEALIAQEGEPFAIPPDDGIPYYEFVKMKKLALLEYEEKVAKGLAPPLDQALLASSGDAQQEAMTRELSRGVVFDEKACVEADLAALNVPAVR